MADSIATADQVFEEGSARPVRAPLLLAEEKLAGRPVQSTTKGSWVMRYAAAARPSTGSDDFYLGSKRAKSRPSGPGTGGPASGGPATRGVAAFGPATGGPATGGAATGGPVTGGAGRGGAAPTGPMTGGRASAGTAKPAEGVADVAGLAGLSTTATSAAATLAPEDNAKLANVVLRAGSRDDNAVFEDFLNYLDASQKDAALARHYINIDVRDRRFVQVVDTKGAPQPGVAVTIVDERSDQVVWYGTTYGDGQVPFYPRALGLEDDSTGPYLIEARVEAGVVRAPWNGADDTVLTMPKRAAKSGPVVLDVAFVVDTTGSMRDEMQAIKSTLLQVTERLKGLELEFDLRYAAVLYRDVGDEYVTATHAFTGDIESFATALRGMGALGGGDHPESMNQALALAIDGLEWRKRAAKVAFVIADAPPHIDYQHDVPYVQSLRAAVASGVRMHTVAASGLGAAGTMVLRQIAQFTRGQFVFIEYGGNLKASAAAHGVKDPGTGNNLHEILFERIRDEVANWGR